MNLEIRWGRVGGEVKWGRGVGANTIEDWSMRGRGGCGRGKEEGGEGKTGMGETKRELRVVEGEGEGNRGVRRSGGGTRGVNSAEDGVWRG